MSKPTEHKTVQARILEYAEAIGWTFVSQKEAEQRRGFDASSPKSYADTSSEMPIKDRAKGRTFFFEDLLGAKVREFNPRCAEAEGGLPGKFPPSPFGFGGAGRHFSADIYGNREFVEHLRNPPLPKGYGRTGRGKFFDHEEKRERKSVRTAGHSQIFTFPK